MKSTKTMTRTHIRESNLIEGFDSQEVDDQSFHAWEWLTDRMRSKGGRNKPLTHEVIEELNRRLTAHQPELNDMWRGTYRSRNRTRVTIGGKEAMNPAFVGRAMDEWLTTWETADPIASHIAFEKIHPFIDGNGRTGRMLMWLRQKQLGQPLTLITTKDRAEYYGWFQ